MTAKVGLLGNMNNNHFSIARYLRDRGIDAEVLLFDNELPHFHPSNDTYDAEYFEYVRQLQWGSPLRFALTSARRVQSDLADYQILLGAGSAPAYCDKAGLRLDAFIPFGGDIWTMLGRAEGNPLRFAKYALMMGAQGHGIRNSRIFHMAPTNALYEGQWRRYRGTSERWFDGVPGVYDGIYGPQEMTRMLSMSAWSSQFQQVRDAADLLLFSSARHFWKADANHPAAKGTHRLLRGIAKFRRLNPQCRIVLATLEYGQQVGETKSLIRELEIEDCVRWFPPLPRKDLMVGLGLADIACAEFENSWIASGVLYEAMVMAKPILAYRDDALYTQTEPDLYDIMNAKEPDQVASLLGDYWRDSGSFQAMGGRGREWYREHIVTRPLEKYLSLVKAQPT
jgi:hypothetical protein